MSPTPARGAVRALRVALLGAASMTLATTAHVVGGGSVPSVAVLVVSGLLVGLVAVTATARPCRFSVLVALLAVEQVLLHWLFAASAAMPDCNGVPLASTHHGGSIEAMGCAAGTGDGLEMVALAPAMWLAHAGAVLATAWLLARGEVWLWRLADEVVEAATASPADRPTARRSVREPAVRRLKLPTPPSSPAAPRGPPVPTKLIARV